MSTAMIRSRHHAQHLPRAILLAATLAASVPAAAQSLGCGGVLVEVGDAQRALLAKCGNPLRIERVCTPRPVVRGWLVDPGGAPTQPIVAIECAPAEDWTFDRGPGTFSALVRLRDAVVESIRDGDKN